MNFLNSAGVSVTGGRAKLRQPLDEAASFVASPNAAEIFSMIGAGVPAGATTPTHDVASNAGSVSAMAGALRRERRTLEARDPAGPKQALLILRPYRRHVVEHQIDVAGEQIGQRRRTAAVGNVLHMGVLVISLNSPPARP